MRQVDKVYAYIMRGKRLLVFEHVGIPEAGWQVPGGTVEPGETSEAAVLREVWEETGLANVQIVRFLGEQMRDMSDFDRDETQRRRFFHLTVTEEPPERWRHLAEGRYIFEFTWAAMPDSAPPLIADLGALLPALDSQ